MKESTWNRISSHPIWSKVIATAIIAIAGLFLTWVASLFGKGSFGELLMEVLSFGIPLVVVLILLLLSVFVTISIKDRKKEKDPEFLQLTDMVVGNYHWTWFWKRDESAGKYYISDPQLLCPHCNGAMECGVYDESYRCLNGHTVPASQIDYEVIFKQIQQNILKQYASEKSLLDFS